MTRSKTSIVAAVVAVIAVVTLAGGLPGTASTPEAQDRPAARPVPASAGVGALGRILPKNGVRHVSGPSEMVLVLSSLLVDLGDTVKKNQVIARLDDYPAREGLVAKLESSVVAEEATIVRLRASLANAELEAQRSQDLFDRGVMAVSDRDRAKVQADVARAQLDSELAQLNVVKVDLRRAQIEVERANIRSPIDGQVLRVHTRAGEKVGADGIVELGETHAMYAVAEVYETDIARVKVGQKARVTSAALPRELTGTVERIAMKVGRKLIVDDDPAAARDVRVIEVEVKLDDSAAAAPFTNLQVEVRFVP